MCRRAKKESIRLDYLLSKLNQSKIEKHPSGRSVDYNGRGQNTWFAGFIGKCISYKMYLLPLPRGNLESPARTAFNI